MEETVFPPSPSWFSPNIITAREDGSVAYGSKTTIVILKSGNRNSDVTLLRNVHTLKITAVAFSPSNISDSFQNTLVSCSEDGYVKLWNVDSLTGIIGHKSHKEQTGSAGKVVSLDWSTANPCYIVSAGENNDLVLWNVLSNSTVTFFFPKNLKTTVISCCPHREKIVAVGGKTGQIHVISLTGSGNVLYKVRGHDNKIQSLSWCPIPFNVFKPDKIQKEFLLASACQDKDICIWRAGTDGKCVAKFQIPTNPLSKKDNQYYGKVGNSFSHVDLLWFEPYKIYSSSNFGELIYFDVKSYLASANMNGHSVQKSGKHSSFFKLGHHFHTKGLFAMAGVAPKPEVVLYKETNAKPESKLIEDLANVSYKVSEKFENGDGGGDVVWEAVVPETRSLMWTAGQDRKIVGCESKPSGLERIANYHTINNFVYCAAVSPHDPNKIAIGAGDGMIRLWNLTDCSDLKIYWQKIKDRVMSLAWHPTRDGLLGYGTSEGRVGLVDTNSSKLPSLFKPGQPQPIYSLSWGPEFGLESIAEWTSKPEFELYGVGDNTLSLYSPSKLNGDPLDLSKMIDFPCKKQTDVCWKPDYSLMAVGNEDGSVCLVEPFQFKIVHTLQMYKKFIESLAWHPSSTSVDSGLSPYHGYFAAGSTDNDCEVRVFNCKKEDDGREVKVERVATLKGHFGYIFSVAWSPHVNGRLVTSSADGSVQIWDVVFQTPLVNFVPSGMALFSIFSPIDSDYVLTGCKTEALHVWKASAQTKAAPSPLMKQTKHKGEKNAVVMSKEKPEVREAVDGAGVRENESVGIAEAETLPVTKTSKESKMFSTKLWKGDGEGEMENCYNLLKREEGEDAGYSLGFLGSEEDFRESVAAEEKSLKKSSNPTESYELALWRGTLKEVLEEKIQSGQLNEFLVSLAPIVSPRVWQEACLSYSKTLAEKKMHRKAASYLIACHKIYEAVQLLVDANLYLEALCIARSRFPKSDPTLKSIVEEYARWLFKTGSFLKACQCYIYLGNYLEVARICGKKSQPEYLSLAALAAKKCGSDLESLEATNALFQCFESNKIELARRICKDHDNLRHVGLLFRVHETIHQLNVGELELGKDVISHVKESFECEEVLFPVSLPKHFHKHCFYTSKRQVVRVLTEELAFAACANEREQVMTHLIKALSTCCRYSGNEDEDLLHRLCVWLSPKGFLTENSFFSATDDVRLLPKVKSMRAFLCAAIIRRLSTGQGAEEILGHLDVINRLKDDLLDGDSRVYFKNLIGMEVLEQRVVQNQNKLARRTCGKKPEARSLAKEESDASTPVVISEGEDTSGESDTREKVNDSENGYQESDTERREVGEEDGREDPPTESETSLKSAIQEDLASLSRIKGETESFERSRISAPNPLPFYFLLRKLCEDVPQSETAKSLLEDSERKWKEWDFQTAGQ